MNFNEEVSVSASGFTASLTQLEPGDADLYLDVWMGDEYNDDCCSTGCCVLQADATPAQCSEYLSELVAVLVETTDGISRDAFSMRTLEKLVVEMAWMTGDEIRRRGGNLPRFTEAFRRTMAAAQAA